MGNGLHDWTQNLVKAKPVERPAYDHLIVRPEQAGQEAWDPMIAETKELFRRVAEEMRDHEAER